MTIVDAVSLTPDQLQEGQEMLFVVKLMVGPVIGKKRRYRIYRCRYDYNPGDGTPQGSRIYDAKLEERVAKALFPVVTYECKPDL